MRSLRNRAALALCISLAMAPVSTQALASDGVRAAEFQKTCKHYVNRAKFKSRAPDAPFEVIAADACSAALDSVTDAVQTTSHIRKQALDFLDRLTVLRKTIIRMNRERVFGAGFSPRPRISTPLPTAANSDGKIGRPGGRVSNTGEYLIAREISVLAALSSWADEIYYKIAWVR